MVLKFESGRPGSFPSKLCLLGENQILEVHGIIVSRSGVDKFYFYPDSTLRQHRAWFPQDVHDSPFTPEILDVESHRIVYNWMRRVAGEDPQLVLLAETINFENRLASTS